MSLLGLVVNPTSGTGAGHGVGTRAHRALAARGHDVVDLSAPSLAQATDRARAAAVAGLDALIVVGGDGMVHLGVNVVAGTDLPLGIVAAGSGDDTARALGLPRHDVEASVAAIESALGRPRTIDAAQVRTGHPGRTGRSDEAEWFVGALSCGIDAAINARANALTWPRGAGRYLRALATELRAFRPYGYRVTADGRVWESAGTLVAVANGPTIGGGIRIAPDARLDDGLLDVLVAGPLTRGQVVRIFPRVRVGRHLDHPAVRVLRAREVTVEPLPARGGPPPSAFADGEPAGDLPLHVRVCPGAVRVLA